MCGGMRCKERHSPFFGPPIFSALRSASRAPIPPAASAVTLQHSRSSVCSIHRAGQRRLEKAADALKVSWGSLPAELADQDIWKPLRGKEGGAAAIAFDVHLEDRRVMDEAVDGGERTRQSRKKLIDAQRQSKNAAEKKACQPSRSR